MKKFIILIPIFNDWKSVFKLLKNIDSIISELNLNFSVLIVNDASTENRPNTELILKNIKSVKIMNMKKNKGHARCNAAGLKFLTEKEDFDYVILMDGDGEDRPEEISLLVKKSEENPLKTITANRVKRSEGKFFKFLYQCHKILTYVFTGKSIKFGNYSCLPKKAVSELVKDESIWSSFSGSVAKTITDRISIPSIRGLRYFGPSKMSFFNLLKHSLSIIAVFKTAVFVRSIIFLFVYFFFTYQFLSIITLIPVFLIFVLFVSVIFLSKRENLNELNNSLSNINNIENLN